MRIGALSALYGFIAGMVAAAVLFLMQLLSRLLWAGEETSLRIFLTILCGGILIAVLRHFHIGESLALQIDDAGSLHRKKRREMALMAGMAIIAVAFGGAVGPEAGILAVVGELTVLINMRLARDNEEARMLGEAGAAGALGGLYGSPPGGAAFAQADAGTPRWQIYLAGLTGLFGFLLITGLFLPEQPLHITLPPYQNAGDGTDMLWALLPAGLGAVVGLAFAAMLPLLQSLVNRAGGAVVQTVVGTICFALLVTLVPILRFSGHHDLDAIMHWGQLVGMGALIGLALLKILALALCLVSGWRGGAAFPLIFAGAAAGAAALWIFPAMPHTVALVAGMAAALTAGLGKPIAAAMIALLLLGTTAIGPLCIGIALGWGASTLAPKSELH